MVKGVSPKKTVAPSDGAVEETGGKTSAKDSGKVKDSGGSKGATKAKGAAKTKDVPENLIDEVTGYEPSKKPVEKPMTTSVAGGTRALEMAIKSGRYDGPDGLKKLQAEIGADGGGDLLNQMMGGTAGPGMEDGDGRIEDEQDPKVRAFLERNFGDFERSRDLATAGQDSLAKALEIARQRRGDQGTIAHSKRRQGKVQQEKDRKFFEREFNNRFIYDQLADNAVEDRGVEDEMFASLDYDEAEFDALEAERLAGEEQAERDEMDREIARRSRSRHT